MYLMLSECMTIGYARLCIQTVHDTILPMDKPIKIAISSCLLGEKTRYDGTDKKDAMIIETLGARFQLVSICPEVEIGLGVPRARIELTGASAAPRAIYQGAIQKDVTVKLQKLADGMQPDLCGFILKSGSPSCGVDGVAFHNAGSIIYNATGVFAKEMMNRYPNMPMAEETSLINRRAIECFAEKVVAYCHSKSIDG